MKKGVISIQFNWIFVLIAGAVLFAFFIGITLHQGNQAKKERQFNALTNVDAALTNIEQSVTNTKESFSSFTVNEAELEIICEEFSEVRIKDSDFSFPSVTSAIFAKQYLKPGKINVWVSNWDVPFRVIPFIYIDDGRTEYFFWGNLNEDEEDETGNYKFANGEFEQLYEIFPDGFSKHKIEELSAITSVEADSYVVIMMLRDQEPSEIHDSVGVDGDFKLINIRPSPSGRFTDSGTIDFFKLSGDNQIEYDGSSKFLKRESVFGAIFAKDKEIYECNMKKALSRLNWLADFHIAKIQGITDNLAYSSSCLSAYYSQPEIHINALKSLNIDSNFDDANENSVSLDYFNTDLTKRSCPVIY